MIGSFVHRQGDTAVASAADAAHGSNPFAMAALYLGGAAVAAVEVDAPALASTVAAAVPTTETLPAAPAPAPGPEAVAAPAAASEPAVRGTNALLAQFYANGTLRVVVGDQERLISPAEALLFSVWLVQHTTARIRSGHA